MDISAFDDIKTALKGQTVLPEPRVSREVNIPILFSIISSNLN